MASCELCPNRTLSQGRNAMSIKCPGMRLVVPLHFKSVGVGMVDGTLQTEIEPSEKEGVCGLVAIRKAIEMSENSEEEIDRILDGGVLDEAMIDLGALHVAAETYEEDGIIDGLDGIGIVESPGKLGKVLVISDDFTSIIEEHKD